MPRNLDPDWRPTPDPHPGFVQFPIDIDTDVCVLCKALVPATDLARIKHMERDQLLDQLTGALTSQLSGSGSNAEPTGSDLPDPGSTSGVGEADGQRHAGTTVAERPTPDPNVPTPEQEATAGRSGVEGANSTQADAAGLPPGGVTAPPASSPREAGGINRSRPGGSGVAPTGRLPLPELGNPARFAR